ncbi:MAG: NUDIX domain-containing protein [Bacteroidaceae bacterium]|nr:NUDIX domain-containing protein [Bacteroidaceae bacterium]
MDKEHTNSHTVTTLPLGGERGGGLHPLHLFRYCPLCGSSQFVENNGKSKRCLDCGFVYYLNPSAATVAVITNERGELLVVRRAKDPARGTLDLPGGFSDCYETSEHGVVREVKEETGLDVDRVEFLFSIPNLYEYSGFTVHTIDMFYRCYVKTGDDIQAHAADDAAEVMWLRPENVNPADFGLKSISKGVERIKALLGETTI